MFKNIPQNLSRVEMCYVNQGDYLHSKLRWREAGLAVSRGDSHSLEESSVDLVREAIEDLVKEWV